MVKPPLSPLLAVINRDKKSIQLLYSFDSKYEWLLYIAIIPNFVTKQISFFTKKVALFSPSTKII